ncbi:MAG: two-component system, oxyanion-binding sensor [Chthoniobacter sp.]|nr:two-component system, oxyanion-binding sensor [Chthoniobacter sp.]
MLRIGFVPLNDCAPLVMAQELGLFRKYGVRVELSREVGWATIRDKIIYGEIEAAHAVAGLVFACNLGLGCIQKACLTGLVLNLHGNAITLSNRLIARGVTDAKTLGAAVTRSRGKRPFSFGVAAQVSSHHFLMRRWLRTGGINPDRDVRLIVVPPPQMFANLKAGHIDGYCVGEPWNSVAVMRGAGWCPATSEDLAPLHPEKILLVQKRFAEVRATEHVALIAALLEACAFCDCAENRERIVETLAQPQYVGAPIEALRMSMLDRFHFTKGRVEKTPDFNVFSRHDANRPSPEKANWILSELQGCGVINDAAVITPNTGRDAFREDVFEKARHLVQSNN